MANRCLKLAGGLLVACLLASCQSLPTAPPVAPTVVALPSMATPPVPSLSAFIAAPMATEMPPPVITNQFSGTLLVACDPITEMADGVVISTGQRTGCYTQRQRFPVTNLFVVSNLDLTLPVFGSARVYISNAVPVTNVITVGTNSFYQTNRYTLSPRSQEFMFIPTNCQPFLQISNGIVQVIGYGNQGSIYTVSNAVLGTTTILGSNSPWVFQTAVLSTNEPQFFSVGRMDSQ